jgi:peptidoglycan/xylan/chitin deacetylase (PgdA/CDA1 family)
MLKTLKQSLLQAAQQTRFMSLVGNSRWRKNRLLILGYHGVSIEDEHEWNPALYLSQELFSERLMALRSCNVLSLADGLRRLASGTLPERSVVITFDDGNYDFLARAYPVLRDFKYPATVYQTTYYSAYNRPVFKGICSYILWKGRGKREIDVRDFTGVEGEWDLSEGTSRLKLATQIFEFSKHVPPEKKDELAQRLAGLLDVDFQWILDKRMINLMKPDEIAQLHKSGVDIQLHTHRHRNPRDRHLFMREIEDNRNFLRCSGQAAAQHFCYPNGDYDLTFVPWLRESGIESAVTCDVGFATRSEERFLLPRLVDTSYLSAIEFEGWLCGISKFLPRRRTPIGASSTSGSPRRLSRLDHGIRSSGPLV